MITWRYASAADVDAYYGERPRPTLQAIVVALDEEPVGIIGLARERDRLKAFSEFKPALEPHLRSIPVMRAIKAAQAMFASAALPVYCVQEGESRILERVGFRSIQDGVYLWVK